MNKSIEYVWNTVSFPEAALLGKRVPKKQFLDSGGLAASDKKLFRENVKTVYWEYTLKPSTCPVLPYKDHEREYLEVAILQIELTSQKGHKRIAEIIHRVIPYPLMLVFYTGADEFALSIAPKRFSQAEHGSFVAESFYTTSWMKCSGMSVSETDFTGSLAWNSLPIQNYLTLYNAWTDRFIGYECSKRSGTFTISKAEDRIERLNRCRNIEIKISELRGQLKNESFNRQVELNTQIKKLEQELKQMAASL